MLCIVEAMKMENEIGAHRDGVVTELSVEPGQPVRTGQVICVVVDGRRAGRAGLERPLVRAERPGRERRRDEVSASR